MNRPLFAAAWIASQQIYDPVDPIGKVVKMIGGTGARNFTLPNEKLRWKNACAVRMSYILSRSGIVIPYSVQTVSGADKRWYFYRVTAIIHFLIQRWGKPDLIVPYPPNGGGPLAGKKGVILFEVQGWSDAGGHATLWDGTICYDHCYFNESGARYVTTKANFWSLR